MVAELCSEFLYSPPWPQDLLGLAFLSISLNSLRGPACMYSLPLGSIMEDYMHAGPRSLSPSLSYCENWRTMQRWPEITTELPKTFHNDMFYRFFKS